MFNIKEKVKARLAEAKKSYAENQEFKQRVNATIKKERRAAYEKAVVGEAQKAGVKAAKARFAPKPQNPILMSAMGTLGSSTLGRFNQQPKKGKKKAFDPFKDLIQ